MFGANKKNDRKRGVNERLVFFEKTQKNIDKKFVFTIYIYIFDTHS